MQGLADGYFVIPYTIGNYLAGTPQTKISTDREEFKQSKHEVQTRISTMLNVKGSKTVAEIHRDLGHLMWDYVGMARTREGLTEVIPKIQNLREEFWNDVRVPGEANNLNQNLELAGRVADFLEFGELLAMDALEREESAGGHFRTEYQTEDGEALRNDEEFAHVAAWEHVEGGLPQRHVEELEFEEVHLATRSYK
jgi:succinate dehydrogenase / fumarate reductase flavoprotein subunit